MNRFKTIPNYAVLSVIVLAGMSIVIAYLVGVRNLQDAVLNAADIEETRQASLSLIEVAEASNDAPIGIDGPDPGIRFTGVYTTFPEYYIYEGEWMRIVGDLGCSPGVYHDPTGAIIVGCHTVPDFDQFVPTHTPTAGATYSATLQPTETFTATSTATPTATSQSTATKTPAPTATVQPAATNTPIISDPDPGPANCPTNAGSLHYSVFDGEYIGPEDERPEHYGERDSQVYFAVPSDLYDKSLSGPGETGISFCFALDTINTISVTATVYSENINTDSFWVQLNDDRAVRWNTFQSNDFRTIFVLSGAELSPGQHAITFWNREPGTELYRISIFTDPSVGQPVPSLTPTSTATPVPATPVPPSPTADTGYPYPEPETPEATVAPTAYP